MTPSDRGVRGWLAQAHPALFSTWAIVAAFSAYFCMYAFRKPFSAASFDGLTLWSTNIELKTAFVISQILGYTLSKFIGIKVCSEVGRNRRMMLLIGLIVVAEVALVAFGALPDSLMVFAIFVNGLPLGMVWGLCVSYLEGRRTSDLLLAGLSTSFIVASAVVKDVGKWLMNVQGVSEAWMPAATGALFFVPFVIAVFMLEQLPAPSAQDEAARSKRTPMQAADRWAFVRHFGPGLGMLLVVYFFLTAYRDFRDNYMAEILIDLLGQQEYDARSAIFSAIDVPVGMAVLATMAALNLIRSNKWGLVGAFVVMLMGTGLLAGSTAMFQAGALDPITWMVGTGLGAYLTYVPFNAVLFERMMAYTRFPGTAVFAIYLADALGYTGSIGMQLFKDLGASGTSRLQFFTSFTWGMAAVGAVLLVGALVYLLRMAPESDDRRSR